MKQMQYRVLTLAFVTVFSTVAPAFVMAGDTTIISNNVRTSSHTGNYGVDGVDGADGAPGADGQSGADGQHVIEGAGTASSFVKTVINGQTIVEESVTSTETGAAQALLHTQTATTSTDEVVATSTTLDTAEEDVTETEAEHKRSELAALLESPHQLLLKYVNALF